MRTNRNRFPKYRIKGKIKFPHKQFESFEKMGNTREELFGVITEKVKNLEIENINLLFNKFIPIFDTTEICKWVVRENKYKLESQVFSLNKESIGGESKKYFLEGAIEKSKTILEKDTMRNILKNLLCLCEHFNKDGYQPIINKFFTTKSRLVVGLGSSHVLETAITLHHIFGIPYIPGSALKGVCRAVAFWKIAKEKNILNNQKALETLQNEFYGELVNKDLQILKYQLLFGAQDFKGLLLFLDAYPCISKNDQIFELDIINVHYNSYYEDKSGKTPPSDWENPTPVYFLTIKPGVKFKVCVLFDKWRWDNIKHKEPYSKVKSELESLLKDNLFLEEIVEEALENFGVGAKTRLGYGVLAP